MTRYLIAFAIALVIRFDAAHAAETPSDTPKPVPATRPEIKAALEALKHRTPRLPLPEAGAQGGVNNGQMRGSILAGVMERRPRARK